MKEESLKYHREPIPGKIAVVPTKRCENQAELSLAYTPGVAVPCLEIADDEEKVYEYTAKGNLVAVVTDGSAVLGLGDIGAAAGKPVMEGKAVLFKRFADVNAFDIELATKDPDKIVETVRLMEPTFGGVNLEDISSPRCFEIEERLKEAMEIPVFHDDQHGTAVIAGAAVLNGLMLAGKDISKVKIAMSGAGAAAVAIAKQLINLGAKEGNIFASDIDGVLYKGRPQTISSYHDFLFRDTEARTLAEIMDGADVFLGISAADIVSKEMVKSMAEKPIIFPMANPNPEITYDAAMEARPDAICGTGRSDYPNQVNNVLGFPAIFRGALDIRARKITEGMKVAASKALAELARKPIPQSVLDAYGLEELSFGPHYIIPKPFDPRVLIEEATAVAKAGMEEGVHRKAVDIEAYRKSLMEKFHVEEM